MPDIHLNFAMTQVLASRNPHYTVLADGIPIFSPKLNEAAANFEKLTAFVKTIRFRLPQLKFLIHFYEKDFDSTTDMRRAAKASATPARRGCRSN